MTLTITAKALESIIGSSFCKNPYHTHSESPEMSTRIIVQERSSAFFSFSTLTSCGIMETDVRIPATIPRIFSFIIYLLLKIRNFTQSYNDLNYLLANLSRDTSSGKGIFFSI